MSNKGEQRVKVKVVNLHKGKYLECAHVSSRLRYTVEFPKNIQVELGQVVFIEPIDDGKNITYKVSDPLIDTLETVILKSQHIVSDGQLYTSLILENETNKQRLHSLIDHKNRLFNEDTCTLVDGDRVKLTMNNGEIFKIEAIKS